MFFKKRSVAPVLLSHFPPLLLVLAVQLLFVIAPPAFGETPENLKAWKIWITEQHTELQCPWVIYNGEERSCEWPGQLSISLRDGGAGFHYSIETFRESTVALPGDEKLWPSNVMIAGKAATLIDSDGKPHIRLNKGRFDIEGEFAWKTRPAYLSVPKQIALISLRENAKALAVNRQGTSLILSKISPADAKGISESVTVEVYRRLVDGIPMTLDTQLVLSVSGKSRELALGRISRDNEVIERLKSPIPARIEPDGLLRVQVKPGRHTITVRTHFKHPVEQFSFQAITDNWPDREYWSFASDLGLRTVRLSGVPSVDTSQVAIPNAWKQLPTYLLQAGATLSVVTQERGEQAPMRNRLNVLRDLWLDFSGEGYTALDRVDGEMYQDWRLNAAADVTIGRAKVGGESVLITQDGDQQGIEIRSPRVSLEAVTRMNEHSNFSALGWQADADQYRATIHLPPGWRVLNVAGVDRISGTWLSRWDLWDIFLVLILIFVTYKLIGLNAALLAALMLLVTYHERNSPLGLWPILLTGVGLLRVAKGRFRRIVLVISSVFALMFVVLSLGFAIQQFRLAIYPSLERSSVGSYSASGSRVSVLRSKPSVKEESLAVSSIVMEGAPQLAEREQVHRYSDLYQVDSNDQVQTGPGQPRWLWNSIHISSTGLTSKEQRISILYSSPFVTRLWRFVSVILVAGFGFFVLRELLGQYPRGSASDKTTMESVSSALIALCIPLLLSTAMFHSTPVHAGEYPPQHLLEELQTRLSQPPKCTPDCSAIVAGDMRAEGNNLRLSLKVTAVQAMAVAVPGGKAGWQPQAVSVNGRGATLRQDDRGLWVLVDAGSNTVKLSGQLVGDTVKIHFPLAVHNLNFVSDDWDAEGLVDQRVLSGTLQLTARAQSTTSIENTLIPEPIKPFVSVTRSFYFAERWRLETEVKRIAPAKGAINVSIPTIPNERVLSSQYEVLEGEVKVHLPGDSTRARWESELPAVESFVLRAAENAFFVETWQFIPSSIWRVSYDGIPAVKQSRSGAGLKPKWKPWPGEQLSVQVARPKGVQGVTQTVESAHLTYSPGKQIHKSELVLDILASQGSDYLISLPEDAEVTSLKINSAALNVPVSNSVKVPLKPGEQTVVIEFRQQQPMSFVSSTPVIRLQGSAANIDLTYELPRDRWPLFLSGPLIGPAMLYWGILLVIVIAACLLPVIEKATGLNTPVTLLAWLLLGLGLSTVNSYGVFIIAVFFFAMAWRKQYLQPERFARVNFNLLQLLLGCLTIVSIMILLFGIQQGLLSSPSMSVVGNNSYSHLYQYYHDRAEDGVLPTATVISVPLITYRIVMLFWSLWMATRLINWASWWWHAFSEKMLWRGKEKNPDETPAASLPSTDERKES